ncbi:methyltransferase domain-containing protein [Celeribacter sp. SCSIO 80788]|uniref:methyltransferase domain-containing protein n=1 Tax=Celeribacter sp. SCSIO 80788 TaxID=3117013 RepID=UPI003DA496F5
MSDWSPTKYAQYADLRLRPAGELMGAVGSLPEGAIMDLGCGSGGVGHLLTERFPGHTLYGLEKSEAMREAALETGYYADILSGDLASHELAGDFALIFTNAALNWVPDHRSVLPHLMQFLAPGGWFAMQVPSQHDAPSHVLAREVASRLDPEAFPDTDANSNVLPPRSYVSILEPFGEVRVWMTEYMQEIKAPFGHPVRHFTQATYLRPYLDHFGGQGRLDAYLDAYDTELNAAYPIDRQGRAWFPFKRLFVVMQKG